MKTQHILDSVIIYLNNKLPVLWYNCGLNSVYKDSTLSGFKAASENEDLKLI